MTKRQHHQGLPFADEDGTIRRRTGQSEIGFMASPNSISQLIRRFRLPGWTLRGETSSAKRSKPARNLTITCGYRSICGHHRDSNDDRCYADATSHLLMVADGMGGYSGGAQASSFMIQAGIQNLLPVVERGEASRDQLCREFTRCVESARIRMQAWAEEHPRHQKMGTTVATAMICGRRLFVAHVGDSRVYLFHRQRLVQLTSDETLAQSLQDAGLLTEAEAKKSRYRHILVNSVSTRDLAHLPCVSSYRLQCGDRILLATDGLYEYVAESEIVETLSTIAYPQVASDHLVKLADGNESRDNVTALVADVSQATHIPVSASECEHPNMPIEPAFG